LQLLSISQGLLPIHNLRTHHAVVTRDPSNLENSGTMSFNSEYFVVFFPENRSLKYTQIHLLPLSFLGCRNMYLTLREEQIFGMFENKELQRIFNVENDVLKGD
jgi:hypothetical protein